MPNIRQPVLPVFECQRKPIYFEQASKVNVLELRKQAFISVFLNLWNEARVPMMNLFLDEKVYAMHEVDDTRLRADMKTAASNWNLNSACE